MTDKQIIVELKAEIVGQVMAFRSVLKNILNDIEGQYDVGTHLKLMDDLNDKIESLERTIKEKIKDGISFTESLSAKDLKELADHTIDRLIASLKMPVENEEISDDVTYEEYVEDIIDNHFGAYINHLSKTRHGVSLLPAEIINAIPDKWEERFRTGYMNFNSDFSHIIRNGMPDCIEAKDEEEMSELFNSHFRSFKKEFKAIYGKSLKKTFKEYLLAPVDTRKPFRCCEEEFKIRGEGRNIDLT